MTENSAGKGDAPRPYDGQRYRNNYETIFRRRRENERREVGRRDIQEAARNRNRIA